MGDTAVYEFGCMGDTVVYKFDCMVGTAEGGAHAEELLGAV